MAEGRSIGTIFAELDLDPSRYMRSQQQLYKDAITTTLSIEENFKKLGIKTSAEFDLMRAKVSNAYEAIKHSAQATANDILRAEEAKSAKLKQIDEQQFGHQTTLLEGLKKNWLASAAVIGTAMVTASKAWDLAKKAAEYQETIASLQELTAQYNLTASAVVRMAKEAVDGQLSLMESAKLAGKAIALGFDPGQMQEFLSISERMTDLVGGEIPEAFEAMEKAAATGRAKGLVQYGIQVDLNKALEDYAKKQGIAKDAIDQHTATQIRAAAIMAEAKKKTDLMGEASISTADRMNILSATVQDVSLMSGQVLIRAFSAAHGAFQWIAAGALSAYAGMMKLLQGYAWFREAMSFTQDSAQKWAAKQKEYADSASAAWAASQDLTGKATKNFQVSLASVDELAQAQKRTLISVGDEAEEAYGRATKAVKKNAEAIKESGTALQATMDWAAQAAALNYKEKYVDVIAESQKDTIDLEININQDRVKATRRMYRDMAHESDDFFEGVSLGYRQMQDEATTFGDAGYEIFNTFSQSSRSAVSSGLFDAIKGDMSGFKTAWEGLCDSILKKLTDIVADMVVEWVAGTSAMQSASAALSAWWSGGTAAVSSGAGAAVGSSAAGAGAGAVVGTAATGTTAAATAGTAGVTGGPAATSSLAGFGPLAIVAAGMYGISQLGMGGRTASDYRANLTWDSSSDDLAALFVSKNGAPTSGTKDLPLTEALLRQYDATMDDEQLSGVVNALMAATPSIVAWGKGLGQASERLDKVLYYSLSEAASTNFSSLQDVLSNNSRAYLYGSTPWWEADTRGESFGFSKGGIARGPESGYTATLHGTELVVSPKAEYPATVTGSGLTIHVHYHGTVIEEKKAARVIAELIYPETKKLEAWRH